MAVRTSASDPIRVDWLIEDLPGRVGLTFAPGKHASSKYSAGGWARDLGADLDKLVADGMSVQVCLLEDEELVRLKIPTLVESARALGIEVIRLPIPDGGTLPSPALAQAVVEQIVAAAKAGKGVVVHCMGRLGRAGTIGGCVLVALGLSAEDALARLTACRGPNCPETTGQRAFLRSFAASRA